MTMIDEGVLGDALRSAANEFAPSTEATNRILAAAATSPPRKSRLPDYVRHEGPRRRILVAAALVLIVGGVAAPFLRSNSSSPLSATPVHGAAAPLQGRVGGTPAMVPYSDKVKTNTLTVTNSAAGFKAALTSSGSSTGSSLKIESTGTVQMTVVGAKVQPVFTKLSEIAAKDGGFVISSQANVGTHASGSFSYGTIVLQVPQKAFALLVTQVQREGHTTSIVTSSNDVTSQYVDLRSRITSLEASRRQYLAIMSRASSIGDILAVQSQLNSMQSQIEVLQGQMNVLNNATTYAALSVTITEAGLIPPGSQHHSGIARAWNDAIGGFVAGFEWLIRISGPALFALLFIGVALGLGRFAWRAIRRRRI